MPITWNRTSTWGENNLPVLLNRASIWGKVFGIILSPANFLGGRHVDDGPELGGSSLAVVLHPVGTGRKNCGWSSPGGLLGSSAGLLVNPEGLFAPIQYILWAQGTYIYIYVCMYVHIYI